MNDLLQLIISLIVAVYECQVENFNPKIYFEFLLCNVKEEYINLLLIIPTFIQVLEDYKINEKLIYKRNLPATYFTDQSLSYFKDYKTFQALENKRRELIQEASDFPTQTLLYFKQYRYTSASPRR